MRRMEKSRADYLTSPGFSEPRGVHNRPSLVNFGDEQCQKYGRYRLTQAGAGLPIKSVTVSGGYSSPSSCAFGGFLSDHQTKAA